jgi:ComF family protein
MKITLALLLERFLRLLFPERCVGCGRSGELFCSSCRAVLRVYSGGLRNQPESLSQVAIIYLFEGPLRHAVHALKYRRIRRAAAPLGRLMAEGLPEALRSADLLVPVPLHADRMAERGFNQAAELAAEVARATGIALDTDALLRTRDTGHQANLDARSRRENVRDAFAWHGSSVPQHVILVDDVLTTGATIGACAAAIRAAGVARVDALALARSRPDW